MKNTLVQIARPFRRPIAMLLAVMLIVSIAPHTSVIAAEGTAAETKTVKAWIAVEKTTGDDGDKYTYTTKLTVDDTEESSFDVEWGDGLDGATGTTYETTDTSASVTATVTYDGLTLEVSAQSSDIADSDTGTGTEVTWELDNITLTHTPGKNEWTIEATCKDNCGISGAEFSTDDSKFKIEGNKVTLEDTSVKNDTTLDISVKGNSGTVYGTAESVDVTGIDTTAPVVKVTVKGDGEGAGTSLSTSQVYKSGETTITITSEDDHLDASEDSEKNYVTYTIDESEETKALSNGSYTITLEAGKTLTINEIKVTDTYGNNNDETKTGPWGKVTAIGKGVPKPTITVDGTPKKQGDTDYYETASIIITIPSKDLINKESITVTVTGGEESSYVFNKSDLEWQEAGDNLTATIKVSDDGTGKVQTITKAVTGVTVKYTNLADEEITEPSAAGLKFIVDTNDPVVDITDTSDGKTTDGYTDQEHIIKVTVDDANFDTTNSKVNIDGQEFSNWQDNGGGNYTMEITLSDNGETAANRYVSTKKIGAVTVKALDFAGHETKGNTTKKDLNYTVDTQPVKVSIGAPTTTELTYYNSNKTITVTATDVNFDSSKSTVKVTYDGGSKEFTNWSEGPTGTWTLTITVSDREADGVDLVTDKAITKIVVTADDKAGKGVSTDSKSTVDTNFIVDMTHPKVGIELPKDPDAEKGEQDGDQNNHYKKNKDIVVTVTDTYFDQGSSSISVTVGGQKQVFNSSNLNWARADNVYTATILVTDDPEKIGNAKAYIVADGKAISGVEVYAYDMAKNEGDADTTTDAVEGTGCIIASYKFIVDTIAPIVTIDMPDESTAPGTRDGVKFFSDRQTITITVKSTNFNQGATKVYYTLKDGSPVELENVTWQPGGTGVHTATITVNDKSADIITTDKPLEKIAVYTKDYAGHDCVAGTGDNEGTREGQNVVAKANFIVDGTNPIVNITMDRETDKGTPNGATDHYSQNKKIDVTVTDRFFDAGESYVEVYIDGQSAPDTFKFTGNTLTITVTDQKGKASATGNVVVTEGKAVTEVKVYAVDAAKRTGAPSGDKKVSALFNFIVDTTDPEVKIDMPDETEAPQDSGNVHYFGNKQEIVITLTSTNFFKERTKVSYELKDGTKGDLNVQWATAGNVHTATVTVGDEAVEGADIVTKNSPLVKLNVYTEDYAGHKAVVSTADNNAQADGNGNVTVTANFIVDTTIPTAKIELPKDGVEHGGTEYFQDSPKEIVVTVTEWNLDKDHVTVTVTGGEGSPYVFNGSGLTWVDSDNGLTHTATITVTDNNGDGMVKTGTAPITGVQVDFNDFVPEHAQGQSSATNFVVDSTAPTVTIDAPASGEYYNENQTVTVTVTEINLDTALSTVTVQGQDFSGSMWMSQGSGVYVMTLSLSDVQSADVRYEDQFGDVSVSVVDYAKNGANPAQMLGFWIDTVDPVVSITVPNDPVNTSGGINYYDAQQTITFTAEDTNLESADITVEVNGETKTFTMTTSLTLTVSDLVGSDIQTLDGALTIVTITAHDRSGRSTTDSNSPNMIVDTIDPVVTASLSGNIQTVFYTVENGRRIYYLVPDRLITNDTEEGELNENYVMTLTVTDKNIAIGDVTDTKGYITTYTSDGGTESWTRDGDVYTLVKSVPVSRNETGAIRFDTRIIDLAGNAARETVYAVLSGSGEGGLPSVITMVFDENGRTSVDARIDRRQSSTSFVDEIPLIDIVPNVEHRGIAMNTAGLPVYDRTFNSFGLTVYDGRDQGDDVFNNSGISRILWALNDGVGGGFLRTENGDNNFSTIVDNQLSGEQVFERSFTIPVAVNGANETNAAILTVMMVDNVGNEIYREFAFGVDTQAPRVSVEYNNDDVANDVYFKNGRTATITVTDKNFDPDDPALSEVTTEVGAVDWQRISDGVYITARSYNTDGDYTLAIQIGDRAGNVTLDGDVSYAGQAVKAFTVDQTAPVIEVSFDNTAVKNNRYYNADRTATVTITEHNFDQGQDLSVPITASLNGEPMAAPQASAFSVGSDVHVATVQFLTDGDYTIGVEYTDLAGNVATAYVGDPFTIDTVAPEIVITGVNPVNTDTAAPVITFTDVNFDSQGYFTDIAFFRMLQATSVDLGRSDSGADTSGVVVTFTDIPHVKNSDGIYELTARATDLAGNEAEPVTMLFSVNRFGSTYFTEDPGTVDLIAARYTKTSQPIQIVEINPNQIVEHSVTMAVNGQTITLTEGADYTVSSEGNSGIGYRYTYDLAASVFEENGILREGSYVLTFYSEDDAGNVNSNRSNSTVDEDGVEDLLDVSFIIDATAPVVSITGVAAGDRIQEESREVTVYFTDGNEVADVTIYLNGEVYSHISREELAGYGGQYTFTVTEQNADQTVRVVVLDAADNEVDTGDIQFYINSSAFNQFVHNRPLFYGSIAGVVGVAGGGTALAILLKRKKRAKVSK